MRRANVLLCVSFIALPGCFGGEIGGGKRLRVSADEIPADTDGGTGVNQPGRDGGVGTKPPPPPPPNAPRDAGIVTMPFTHATAGDRCVDDLQEAALVLADEVLSCPEWATVASAPAGHVAVASLESVSGPGTYQIPTIVCLDGACADFAMALVVDSIVPGTSLLGSYTIDVDGSRIVGDVDASWCAQSGAGAPAATDLAISEVAAYQAVKISMMEDGSPVTNRNAPVIEGKRTLVRVSVEPGAGFTSREILGRLDVDGTVVEARQTIRGGSTDGDMDSTLNFEVPAELVQLGATWAVSLHESSSQCDPTGGVQNRFPETGTAELGVESSGGNFKIVIVPVRYNADGSGRLPDLEGAQLQRYVDRSFAIYPATDVEVTVRDPMDWNRSIRASGTGWSGLLGAIADLRSQDDVPSNVYYFGSFRPRNTFGQYCGGGCVAGLGNVPGANDTYSRTSIGLGFSGEGSVETYTHEVGHSLGRGHAPCGVSGDGSFPYRGARIGVWGYHLVEEELMDPSDWRDMMSYCDPQWISDYYYERIHRRIEHANTTVRFNLTGDGATPTSSSYRVLVVDRETMSWSTEGVTFDGEPGEPIAATLYKRGSRRDVTAYISRFDHLDGGFVYLPEPLLADEVEIEGFGRLRTP